MCSSTPQQIVGIAFLQNRWYTVRLHADLDWNPAWSEEMVYQVKKHAESIVLGDCVASGLPQARDMVVEQDVIDEGRRAKWHIDVRVSEEPHWGVLGTAIGSKVVDQIPYVTGIDKWIGLEGGKPDPIAVGKLKGMGSSSAATGAVGLYHVENVTPEAIDQGRDLLVDDHQVYVIDDAELARIRDENSGKARSYTNLRLYDDDNLVKIALTGKAPY